MFAWSRDWITLLPLRKTVLPSIFNSVGLLSGMSCIKVDIELADVNVIKELGVF